MNLLKNISSPLTLQSFGDDFVVLDIELVLIFVGGLFRKNMFIYSYFLAFNDFKVVLRFKSTLIGQEFFSFFCQLNLFE